MSFPTQAILCFPARSPSSPAPTSPAPARASQAVSSGRSARRRGSAGRRALRSGSLVLPSLSLAVPARPQCRPPPPRGSPGARPGSQHARHVTREPAPEADGLEVCGRTAKPGPQLGRGARRNGRCRTAGAVPRVVWFLMLDSKSAGMLA